jgi:Putative MetA-pathway of phenol degradation
VRLGQYSGGRAEQFRRHGISSTATWALAVLSVLLVLSPLRALASGQLPLTTEDPYSPCRGTLNGAIAYGVDLIGPGSEELGQQAFRSHVDMVVPEVQLNYGITPRLQGRVQGELPLTTASPNGRAEAGFGDFTAGLKYRFIDEEDGPESDGTCDPDQSEDAYGLQGPASVSIFPQFTFPTGSSRKGSGFGQYSLFIPLDVARQFGPLILVGEADFDWNYHDRTSPNEFGLGIAAYYSLTPKWDLLGEQRFSIQTIGHGTATWLMNVGVQYQINDYVGLFGAVGTGASATLRVPQASFTSLVGVDITFPLSR